MNSRELLSMLNEEIQQKLMAFYYEEYFKNSGAYINCSDFIDEWNIDTNLFEANLKYLINEGLLKGTNPIKKREGHYQITNLGINAIKNPEKYLDSFPFLMIFTGDISNSTIMQAGNITFEGSYYNAVHKLEQMNISAELMKTVEDIKNEADKREPDLNRFRNLLRDLKEDTRVHSLIAPIIADLVSKILLG